MFLKGELIPIYPQQSLLDHQNQKFVFSNQVKTAVDKLGLVHPSNVTSHPPELSKAYGVYFSLEARRAHEWDIEANRHNFYQLLPSGPYEVNYTYYSTWPEVMQKWMMRLWK